MRLGVIKDLCSRSWGGGGGTTEQIHFFFSFSIPTGFNKRWQDERLKHLTKENLKKLIDAGVIDPKLQNGVKFFHKRTPSTSASDMAMKRADLMDNLDC